MFECSFESAAIFYTIHKGDSLSSHIISIYHYICMCNVIVYVGKRNLFVFLKICIELYMYSTCLYVYLHAQFYVLLARQTIVSRCMARSSARSIFHKVPICIVHYYTGREGVCTILLVQLLIFIFHSHFFVIFMVRFGVQQPQQEIVKKFICFSCFCQVHSFYKVLIIIANEPTKSYLCSYSLFSLHLCKLLRFFFS